MKSKNKLSGFTIIEVMIVLAIAAVILSIVFLAVPQLQRSSRNTQRSTDAYKVLSAINECMSNNNGAASSCFTSSSPPADTAVAPSYYGSSPVLSSGGYLDLSKILQLKTTTLYVPGTVPTAITSDGFPTDTQTSYSYSGYTCTSSSAFGSGATNQYVVLYKKEVGSNSSTTACISP